MKTQAKACLYVFMNLLYNDYISVVRYRIKFLHKHYYFVILCDNLNCGFDWIELFECELFVSVLRVSHERSKSVSESGGNRFGFRSI